MNVGIYSRDCSQKGSIQYEDDDVKDSNSCFDEVFGSCFNSAAEKANDFMHSKNRYRAEEKKDSRPTQFQKDSRPTKFPQIAETKEKIKLDLSASSLNLYIQSENYAEDKALARRQKARTEEKCLTIGKEVLMTINMVTIKECRDGAIIGALAGAALGGIIGGTVFTPTPGTIAGGFFGGLVLGAFFGAGFAYILTEDDERLPILNSKGYRAWIEEKAKKPTRELLLSLSERYFPREMVCQISQCVPALPVMLRQGGPIYEKEDLERYIEHTKTEEKKLRKQLRREGKTPDEIAEKVAEFQANKILLGEDEYISSVKMFIPKKEVFEWIEGMVTEKINELSDLANKLPSDILRRLFVTLMENKNYVADQKMKHLEAQMAGYSISERDRVQIREKFENSV